MKTSTPTPAVMGPTAMKAKLGPKALWRLKEITVAASAIAMSVYEGSPSHSPYAVLELKNESQQHRSCINSVKLKAVPDRHRFIRGFIAAVSSHDYAGLSAFT